MGRMNITTDDLLDALRAAMGTAEGEGHTVQELVAATGWGKTNIRQVLGHLHHQGRLEVVRVKRPCLDGRMQSIPAYRIKNV